MKTWLKRTAAALVSLGVFVGMLVVGPTAAMATTYVTCTPNTVSNSRVIAPDPTYHDLYVGVTATGGDLWWEVRNVDNGATLHEGYVNNTTISRHYTLIWGGNFRLILTCFEGSGQGYLS